MNKIDERLALLKAQKKLGLMTHVIVGYPTIQDTIAVVNAMEEAGVDFVELQIPFSDPLADGPTIMKACEKALENGTKVEDGFTVMRQLTEKVQIPLLFMCYYNTLFAYGTEKFCKKAKESGASGLIVPDMPLEEEDQEHFSEFCKKYNLANIRVVSPASTKERMKMNNAVASGFVYCTARQGTTDAKKGLDPDVSSYLSQAKKIFSVPIAVGFGISSKERVDLIRPYADVAVVGSAVVDIITNSPKKTVLQDIKTFIHSLHV